MGVLVGRIIENDVQAKVIQLLEEHQEIPLIQFPLYYLFKYDTLLDIDSYKFDDGIVGFFNLLDSVVFEHNHLKIPIVKLKYCREQEQQQQQQEQQQEDQFDERSRLIKENIFDPENILWIGSHAQLIDYKPGIALSPLELAKERYPFEMSAAIRQIKRVMEAHPDGILVSDLCNYISIDKHVFSVTSIDAATVEYPELFYRVEPEVDGKEARIYDGTTYTLSDLKGEEIDHFEMNSPKIVFQTIMSGLYQKTLVLIREAGKQGLKLAVWRKTVFDYGNFKIKSKYAHFEEELLQLDPVTLFQIWASYKLLEIKSHPTSKNDLRIHFPSEPKNYMRFLENLKLKKLQILKRKKLMEFMSTQNGTD